MYIHAVDRRKLVITEAPRSQPEPRTPCTHSNVCYAVWFAGLCEPKHVSRVGCWSFENVPDGSRLGETLHSWAGRAGKRPAVGYSQLLRRFLLAAGWCFCEVNSASCLPQTWGSHDTLQPPSFIFILRFPWTTLTAVLSLEGSLVA